MHAANKYVVIVAGGKGTRMGNALPKQFLSLRGIPVLAHSIIAFQKALPDAQFILVLPPDQLSYAQIVLQALHERIDVAIVSGGATRFHSVQNGLNAIDGEGIVFVHDGARPLLTEELIMRCYNQAVEKGSAIPAIPVSDSMRLVDGELSKPVNRENLRVIQTPQTFQTGIILPAFRQQYSEAFTDEATVAEACGQQVFLVQGERSNLKITTPEDMVIAEALLTAR